MLVINTAVVAISLGALWFVVGSAQHRVAERHANQVADAVGAAIAPELEHALGADDLAGIRLAVVRIARAERLGLCRISLGDGSVLADTDPAAINARAIPEQFPAVAAASGTSHRFELNVKGRGTALLEIEPAPAEARSENLEYGFAGVCVAAFILLGFVSVRAQRRSMPITLVGSALDSLQRGEKELAALELADSCGGVGAAWNELIREIAKHRARERFDSVVTHHAQGGERDEAVGKMIDSLWHGVVALDEELRIRYCNGAAAVFLSGTRDGLLGTPVADRISDPQAHAKLSSIVKSRNRAKVVFESRTGEGDGGSVLRFSGRSIAGAGGAVLLIEDVTQQRVADRSKNAFVEQATHELRTPLTNIRLYVESLVEKPDADVATRSQHLNIVNQEVRRLERIVGDMLSVSEIEAGTLKLALHEIRLSALFADLESEYAAPARAKNLRLRFDLPPKLPTIVGDRDKLLLAITNVIGNAIKYTPEGGEVAVRIRADQEFVIEVADSGIGIGADDIDRIFDRFYRAKDSRVEKIVGTGLGLALAREVMRLHGGDIAVQSVPDKGSTFSIRMPLRTPLSKAA